MVLKVIPPGNAVLAYVDQNILSHLREGQSAREELAGFLRKLQEQDVVFVYSVTHVDECCQSLQTEKFVQVMEEVPVHFMEFQNASDQEVSLSLDKTRVLLLEPEDETHRAKRLIEDILKAVHFTSGWLGEIEEQELKDEFTAENAEFWDTLRRNIDWDVLGEEHGEKTKQVLTVAQGEIAATIKSIPIEQARSDWERGWASLRERLPANYAQLDQVADEEAVAFVFSCLDAQSRVAVESQYPQGFWSRLEGRKTGELSGLAFMLFMCGLVRDRRVKKGKMESRIQHFRGQFRDGLHIESASMCAMLITCDAGLARLARSIYAYAGVETQVIELKIRATTA